MNSSEQNTYKTFAPLTWILKLFAINSNVENLSMALGDIVRVIITACVLGSFIVSSLYYKIEYHYSELNISIKLTDAMQMIYDYCQYIVDLYFVYKFGRHISAEYFKQYDILDSILGTICYHDIKKRLIKLILLFTILWAMSSCFDFFAWVLSYGWTKPIVYSVAYIYLYIKMATMLDFTSHIIHAEIRLAIIGDIVLSYYSSTECSPDTVGNHVFNKNWFCTNGGSRTSRTKLHPHPMKTSPEAVHRNIKLAKCYLMLTDQVAYVNSMYGLRILLNSLSLLIDMVRFTNIAVRIVLKSQDTTYDSRYLPAASNLLRLLMCAVIFINVVYHCERVYCQKDRIITVIDHLLIDKKPSKKLSIEVTELRELITNRPIYFDMANFFKINYSMLASIGSVVVTYTIILLQSTN